MEINFGVSKWGFDRKLYPILILLLMVFGAVQPAIVLLGIVIVLEKDAEIVKESIHALLAGFINTILSTLLTQGSNVISRFEILIMQLVPEIGKQGISSLFRIVDNIIGLFIAIILFGWTLYVINRGVIPLVKGYTSKLPLRKLALAMYTKAIFDGFKDDVEMVKGDLKRTKSRVVAGVENSQPVKKVQRSVTLERRQAQGDEFDDSEFNLDLE